MLNSCKEIKNFCREQIKKLQKYVESQEKYIELLAETKDYERIQKEIIYLEKLNTELVTYIIIKNRIGDDE